MAFLSQNFDDQSLAAKGERAARHFYRQRGWQILGRNIFNNQGKRAGEIDFIAVQSEVICFVEVKTRRREENRFGSGWDAVDYFKQKKLLKIVQLFLVKYPAYRELRPQIDVCLVQVPALDNLSYFVTIIPNAVSDDFGWMLATDELDSSFLLSFL